ncbi:hypothetical protein DRQ09_01800 [candidate division KSB1 bacterium]|nr:MAG: hypothetical protein DRQ09_01800 [candidate division KSB1 bacterium]
MGKKLKLIMGIICIALLFFLFAFSGCSKYANKEQLAQLEHQKQAALAAEKKLDDCKKEKEDLKNQIAQKQKELKKLQKDLEAIK